MKPSISWKFTAILLLLGFMVAVQYNTVKHPEERDTRDIWAIRQELAEEKKTHSELLKEIRELDETLSAYQTENDGNAAKALGTTVDNLRRQAGETDLTGPGIVIEVKPSPESIAYGMPITSISSDLLIRFVNDLNRFKGHDLEIDGKRYTILSSIRDINGETSVNGLPIKMPPFQIKVVSETMKDSEKLYNYLLASSIQDDFYVDNLLLEIGKPQKKVTINGWPEKFKNEYLKELPKGE